MTTSITFDSLVLTLSGSVANFPDGYPTVLNTPTVVYNTPSRTGGIPVTDSQNTVKFSASYSIFGGRSQYDSIKAKESVLGTLEIVDSSGTTTINNVILRAVSMPSQRASTFRCSLEFELISAS